MSKRICKIEVEAFRGYDSKQVFDLTTTTGRPASLVVLYAPNGFGKTSFFDAVEWGLTGTIKRFVDNNIIKEATDKQRGKILHNYVSAKVKGTVEIHLEGQRSIKRMTKLTKPGANKWDYNKGKLVDDSSLLSLDDKLLAKVVNILTQESGDQAICFTTPEGRFDALKGFWDSQNDTNIYKSILGVYKAAQTKKDIVSDEIKYLLGKISTNINQSGIRIKLNELIEDFNLNSSKSIDVFSEHLDLTEVDSRHQSISLIKQQLQDEFASIGVKRERILALINGYDIHVEKKNALKAFNDDYTNLDTQLKGAYELNEYRTKLAQSERKLISEKNILDKKYYLKSIIEDYLIIDDDIQKLINYNHDASSALKKDRQLLADLASSTIKLQSRLRSLKNSLESKTSAQRDLEKHVTLFFTHTQQIAFYKKRESLSQTIADKRKTRYDLELLLNNNIRSLLDIGRFSLDQAKIPANDKLEKDFLELKLAAMQIQEVELRLKNLEDSFQRAKSMQETLATVISLGRSFVEASTASSCPLCKTEFGEYTKLLASIQEDSSAYTSVASQESIVDLRQTIQSYNSSFDSLLTGFRSQVQLLLNASTEKLSTYRNKHANTEAIKFSYRNLIQITEADLTVIAVAAGLQEEELSETRLAQLLSSKASDLLNDTKYSESIAQELVQKEEQQDTLRGSILNKENDIESTRVNILAGQSSIIYKSALELLGQLSSVAEGLAGLDNFINDSERTIESINIEINNLSALTRERSNKFQALDEIKLKGDLASVERNRNSVNNEVSDYLNTASALNIALQDELLPILSLEHTSIENSLATLSQQLEKLNMLIATSESARSFIENTENLNFKQQSLDSVNERLSQLEDAKEKSILYIKNKIALHFDEELINEIYQKIEPHPTLKHIKFVPELEGNKPGLDILVSDSLGSEHNKAPVVYFSAAQVNILSLSIFLAKAIRDDDAVVNTIFLDDPIQFLDSINMLSFIDLIRTIISDEHLGRQLFISTHDENFFKLLQRKIDSSYYDSKFIELETFGKIKAEPLLPG